MTITVKTKPSAKEEKIEKIDQNSNAYKVWVKEKPEDGKANEAVIRVLSKHFKVPSSHIKLLVGKRSGQKVFELQI